MDKVKYREHKVLLKPDRFMTTADFAPFWQKIKSVAAADDVGIDQEPNVLAPSIRTVSFYDTKSFDLYRNAFILRKRVRQADGLPEAHELTFKFRHPDVIKARAIDIRASDGLVPKIKFKEEVLQTRDGSPGSRSIFSHNYVLEAPEVTVEQRFGALAARFPALATLEVHPDADIALVNGVVVEEIEAKTGIFRFGHGYTAKSSIAVWRNSTTQELLAGEFSFQSRFHVLEAINSAAKRKSERFYQSFQTAFPQYLAPGATKTSLIYGAGIGHD